MRAIRANPWIGSPVTLIFNLVSLTRPGRSPIEAAKTFLHPPVACNSSSVSLNRFAIDITTHGCASMFNELFPAVVAIKAKRLKLTVLERGCITTMGGHMVSYSCCCHTANGLA